MKHVGELNESTFHYHGRYVLKIDIQKSNCTENPTLVSVLEPDCDLEYICNGKSFVIVDMIYPVLDDSSIRKLCWRIS